MNKQSVLFLMFILFLSINGCATTSQFINLELGMSKEQVIDTIGKPDIARGAIMNKYNQLIEVWEYDRLVSNWSWDKKRMWVYFSDGQLVQWGEAGDWRREADRIHEIRFR